MCYPIFLRFLQVAQLFQYRLCDNFVQWLLFKNIFEQLDVIIFVEYF